MITFITGVPGSGKTLYCIDKLLRNIVDAKVKAKDKYGNDAEIVRKIYTNIKGLLIDHELIDADYLNDWHNRANPGDVIVYDEVQEVWKPRPNGSKVPDAIGKLETHRHMGVDFIVISQHPLLVDRNVIQLAGRHLHVRRVAGLGAAVVYEWDHCSRSLLYSNAMTKWPWRYDKKVFKLYKSAELHTKQPRKLPGLIWFLLLAIAGGAYFAPTTYENITSKGKPKEVTANAQPKPENKALAALNPASAPLPAQTVAAAPVAPSGPIVSGCAAARKNGEYLCRCYATTGEIIDLPESTCNDVTKPPAVQLAALPSKDTVRVMNDDDADQSLARYLASDVNRDRLSFR